jgi:hypothetical protein
LPADTTTAPAGPPGQTPPAQPGPETAPKADPAYGDVPDSSVENPDSQIPGIRRGRDIVVRYTPDRSRQNITLLALLGGSSVLFGAVGLYFHFDSQTASDEVSAKSFTGHPWTPERQARFDEAHRSRDIAITTYAIGSALLLTTAVVYMLTEPELVETVITPHTKVRTRPSALVAPVKGGALVGGSWRF